MKNFTHLCFLAFLCLHGSALYSQKVAAPPTAADGSPATVAVYGEIRGLEAGDTLNVTIWDEYLKPTIHIPEQKRLELPTVPGQFFDGSSGTQTFRLDIPNPQDYQWISIRHQKKTLIDRFLIRAGDRVRLRIDLLTGQALFGGPQADYFQLQQMVRNAFDQESFNRPPLMVTGNPERSLSNPATDSLYRLAQANASDIRLLMEFIVPGTSDLAHAAKVLDRPLEGHPVWDMINLFEGRVDSKFLDIIRTDALGKLLGERIRFLSEAYRSDSTSRRLYSQKLAPLMEIAVSPEIQARAPRLVQAQLDWTRLQAKAEEKSFLDLLDAYAAPLRDRLYALYVFDNYTLMENPAPVLQRGLAVVRSPWIRERFSEFLALRSEGAPMLPVTLTDREGNALNLEQFRDKTVLLSFWITGCRFCMDFYQNGLKEIAEHFKDNPDIIVITVGADSNRSLWEKSVTEDRYCPPTGTNLYADRPSDLLDSYQISSFPHKMLLSPGYRISRVTIPSNDSDGIIRLMEEAHQKAGTDDRLTTKPK